MHAMRRRKFITLIGGAVVTWPLAARAQQMPVIGYLNSTDAGPSIAGFRRGLAEAGYVEGKNVTIAMLSAHGQYNQLPALAADLVRRQVNVIATTAPVAALAAKGATAAIPIVFILGSDPVKDGLVASLNRPGGNITGITFLANLLSSKRLELLHQIVPSATVIAVLLNPDNANAALEMNDIEAAARALGLRLIVENARTETEIDTAFANIAQQRAGAVFTSGDAFHISRRDQIVALGFRYKLPIIAEPREFAQAGALMSYGADRSESYRQFGLYVGRVLKGEKPADLPVQQPTKFQMVINIRTAMALGIEVPNSLLLIADEQIE
jgi:putative ABC transport system substrate-binding protein